MGGFVPARRLEGGMDDGAAEAFGANDLLLWPPGPHAWTRGDAVGGDSVCRPACAGVLDRSAGGQGPNDGGKPSW